MQPHHPPSTGASPTRCFKPARESTPWESMWFLRHLRRTWRIFELYTSPGTSANDAEGTQLSPQDPCYSAVCSRALNAVLSNREVWDTYKKMWPYLSKMQLRNYGPLSFHLPFCGFTITLKRSKHPFTKLIWVKSCVFLAGVRDH